MYNFERGRGGNHVTCTGPHPFTSIHSLHCMWCNSIDRSTINPKGYIDVEFQGRKGICVYDCTN